MFAYKVQTVTIQFCAHQYIDSHIEPRCQRRRRSNAIACDECDAMQCVARSDSLVVLLSPRVVVVVVVS